MKINIMNQLPSKQLIFKHNPAVILNIPKNSLKLPARIVSKEPFVFYVPD